MDAPDRRDMNDQQYLDTHCHIDLFDHPEKIVRETERGPTRTTGVTNLPSHFRMGLPYVSHCQNIQLALGLHPLMANQHSNDELKLFEELLGETSCIGEVGLDFSREGRSTAKKQVESFRFVLSNIDEGHRLITIHSRGAEREVLQLLEDFDTRPSIFHWYSGPLSLTNDIVEAGHYFSLNPAMLESKKGKSLVERVPKERILTETDGPHVETQGRAAHPNDVRLVIRKLADWWGSSITETRKQIAKNFHRLTTHS